MKNRLEENFFYGYNSVVNNKELSLQAIGLYSFLCSKPNDWDFNYRGLSSQRLEGKKALRSCVRELVKHKILIRIQVVKQYKNGKKYAGYEWVLHPTEEDLKNYIDPIDKWGVPFGGTTLQGDNPKGNDLRGDNRSNTKPSNNDYSNNEVVVSTPTISKDVNIEDLPPDIKRKHEQIAKWNEEKKEKIDFTQYEVSDFIEFINSEILTIISKFPSFCKLPKFQRKIYIEWFAGETAPTKTWDNKNRLADHMNRKIAHWQDEVRKQATNKTPTTLGAQKTKTKYSYSINGYKHRHDDDKKFESHCRLAGGKERLRDLKISA